MWRRTYTWLAALALLGVGGLGAWLWIQVPVDLRTDYAKQHGPSDEAQRRGRALMERSLEAVGGADRWRALREESVGVLFEHDFTHWLLRRFFMPVEFSGQQAALFLRPGGQDVRLEFRNGERQGTTWGLRDGKAFKAGPDGATAFGPDRTIEFHLPSYRWVFFIAFYLSEAELVTYAGTQDLQGETYDLVYATWNRWEPHRGADQYLAWIHRETARIDFVQSTVREMVPRSKVVLALDDYRSALGIQFPHRLRVFEDLNDLDQEMHQIRVLDLSLGGRSEQHSPEPQDRDAAQDR